MADLSDQELTIKDVSADGGRHAVERSFVAYEVVSGGKLYRAA
jgi:hypothetical protein